MTSNDAGIRADKRKGRSGNLGRARNSMENFNSSVFASLNHVQACVTCAPRPGESRPKWEIVSPISGAVWPKVGNAALLSRYSTSPLND